MMKDKEHKDFQNELIEFLYGELSPEKEKELKAHLEECASCRDTLSRLSSVRELLGKWEDVEPPYRLIFLASSKESFFSSVRSFFSRLSPVVKGVSVSFIFLFAFLVVASLVNLEVSYEKGKFHLSTALFPKAKIKTLTPADREEIYQAIRAAQEETLATVNNLLLKQDQAQREDLAQAFDELLDQIDERRRADLAYFGEGLSYLDQRSLLNYQRTKELMKYVLKTSGKPPR